MGSDDFIPSVLIVDDDDDIRDILSYGYNAAGFEVNHVRNGGEALELLERKSFDIVVADIDSSDSNINGIELCRIIKEKHESDVIMVTSLVNNYAYEEILAQGASDFIEKPIRLAEIIIRTKRVVNYRYQIELKEIENKELKDKLESVIVGGDKNDKSKIVRSIEFPQEYSQACVSILSHFSAVLRRKMPNKKARIQIDQDGIKVRMVIETEQGDKETIEKTLTEYGLVVTGRMNIEEFTDDRILALELRNELRIAQLRIENQREIIGYQNTDICRLNSLLEKAILPSPINVDVSVPVHASSNLDMNQTINCSTKIDLIGDKFRELGKQFPNNSDELKYIEELTEAAEVLLKCKSKDELSESPSLSKIKKFITNIEKTETIASKVISTTKDGIKIGMKLAGYYNSIAQWCGIPQIPTPFVKS